MKVIITGATGWVGSNVLRICLAHPLITHIVLLQRRPHSDSFPKFSRPSTRSPIVETIVHTDFASYPASLIPQFASASAILWCLGGRHNQFPDLETAWTVNVTYTRACAEFLQKDVAPTMEARRKLRFVLCSGAKAEWDMQRELWFLKETRRMKGAAEMAVFALEGGGVADGMRGGREEGVDWKGRDREEFKTERFEVYTCRPAVILNENPGWIEWVHGMVAPSVGVDELAIVMVDLALGKDRNRIWEFAMIKERARELARR